VPIHKINIQTNNNGHWIINGSDPELLHAFVRFYNAMYGSKQTQNDEIYNTNYTRPIIIDNQTGTIIQDPF
jgi:hypothetical protein